MVLHVAEQPRTWGLCGREGVVARREVADDGGGGARKGGIYSDFDGLALLGVPLLLLGGGGRGPV